MFYVAASADMLVNCDTARLILLVITYTHTHMHTPRVAVQIWCQACIIIISHISSEMSHTVLA